MKKLFVFAIGGTGSRVLRSLTMLLAGNAPMGNFEKIIPIVLDLDSENADTKRSLRTLSAYERIENMTNKGTGTGERFFSMPLGKINDKFEFPFFDGGKAMKFSNYINEGILSDVDKDLVHSLYDTSHGGNTELYLDLAVGFKGNPNIGSIVFNDIKNHDKFTNFENTFVAGDEIFIISSIFGGTGASGFPQLVTLLRNSNNGLIANSPIGAIIMLPYFNVGKNPNGANVISSEVFISKTKAALSYYQNFINPHITGYYVAEPNLTPVEYSEGGQTQKNDTHIAELIAASAILDFAKGGKSKGDFFEFGITRPNAGTINLLDFLIDAKETIAEPLIRLRYFQWLYQKHLGLVRGQNPPFLKSAKDAFNPLDNDLDIFFKQFDDFISELGEAGRKLETFDKLDAKNLDAMVKGKTNSTGFFSSAKLDEGFFTTELNKEFDVQKSVLEAYYNVVQDAMKKFREFKEAK